MSFKQIDNWSTKYRFWQRLEPRARADDFQRSIQAPIRDPLWMLTRQWQVGEFRAEDAGSPVRTQLQTERTRLTRIKLGKPEASSPQAQVMLISESKPLETLVEQESVGMNIRLAVQIGQQFERELRERLGNDSKPLIDRFRSRYPFKPLTDEQKVELDDATQRFYLVIAGRALNGAALFEGKDVDSGKLLVPTDLFLTDEEKEKGSEALSSLQQWYAALYAQPSSPSDAAWQSDRLDYSFSVSAPEAEGRQTVLVASEYASGELDWHDFSIHHDPDHALGGDDMEHDSSEDEVRETDEQAQVFVPTNVSFYGMPNLRWWAFEDRQTDFGDLYVNTTDLGKLLVMEFALVYGNDWYILPAPLKIGSLCRVQSLVVTDVFGNEFQIDPADSSLDGGQDNWNMFGISIRRSEQLGALETNGNQRKWGDFLFLPPVLGRPEMGDALEEVRFLRDEMANMVWAVEHTITNGLGEPQPGSEACRDRSRRAKERHERDVAAAVSQAATKLGDAADAAAQAAASAASATTPEAAASYAQEASARLREAASAAAEAGSLEISDADEAREKDGIAIKYRLASTVPGNWIPYVPVHTGSDKRSIQFRQAAMLRDPQDGDGSEPIKPRTRILNPASGTEASVLINEETLSRAGLRLQIRVQRTRWFDGSTYVWLGRHVGPGQGEGSSGLRFDYLAGE